MICRDLVGVSDQQEVVRDQVKWQAVVHHFMLCSSIVSRFVQLMKAGWGSSRERCEMRSQPFCLVSRVSTAKANIVSSEAGLNLALYCKQTLWLSLHYYGICLNEIIVRSMSIHGILCVALECSKVSSRKSVFRRTAIHRMPTWQICP